MAAMTEYPGARAFLFHTERKEDGRLYGDVLMTDLDTLRQDIERNTLYPYGVNLGIPGTARRRRQALKNGRQWSCAKRTP